MSVPEHHNQRLLISLNTFNKLLVDAKYLEATDFVIRDLFAVNGQIST